MKRRKRTVYTAIELLEGSGVGIPSYPDAHNSFIKSLSEVDKMAEDETATVEEKEETTEVETSEEAEVKEATEADKEEIKETEETEEVAEEKEEAADLEEAKSYKDQLKKELAEIQTLKKEIKKEVTEKSVEEIEVKNKGLADTKRSVKQKEFDVKYEKGDTDFFQKWGDAAADYFSIKGVKR